MRPLTTPSGFTDYSNGRLRPPLVLADSGAPFAVDPRRSMPGGGSFDLGRCGESSTRDLRPRPARRMPYHRKREWIKEAVAVGGVWPGDPKLGQGRVLPLRPPGAPVFVFSKTGRISRRAFGAARKR